MAQNAVVVLVDDLDEKDIPKGKGETVTFALDGRSYEIDLRDKNAAALRATLKPFVAAARVVTNRRGGARSKQPAVARGHRHSQRGRRYDAGLAKAIREWAFDNGHVVSDRGRIPVGVLKAYDEAHP